MISLTPTHKGYQGQFQQNIDFRVLLFKRKAGATASKTVTGYGTNEIYIQLTDWCWLYSICVVGLSISFGRYEIYFSDNPKNVAIASIADEHWYPLICHDSQGYPHTLSFDYSGDDNGSPSNSDKTHILPPLYAKYLKIKRSIGTFDAMYTNVVVIKEDYFDITNYCRDEITRTRRMDQTVRHYQAPTAQIILDNSDGLFNRRNTKSPYYQYLKSGTRFTIDVKFRGAAWEDPAEWIPLGSFRAKKFQKNDNAKTALIYGEAGRALGLSKTTQRIFEQVPVREFAKYLLKDDNQQKPFCALIPRKNQVRTMVEEELGVGKFNDPEYEKGFQNLCDDTLYYSSIAADQNAIYMAINTLDVPVNHGDPPTTPDTVTGTITILINNGGGSISLMCTSSHYTDIIGDTANIYPKICSDGEFIYLFDDIHDYKAMISTYDIEIKKIEIATGRIIDSEHNVLNMPGPVSTGHSSGPFYDKKNDVLVFGVNYTINGIRWYQVDKTTLKGNGTSYSKTYSIYISGDSRNVVGGYYDDIFDRWHFLIIGDGLASTDQYELVTDSSFNEIEIILLDINLSKKRFGLIIRPNRDIICSIQEGQDKWLYTHAKRQFWLKGNIQDTNGPLKDTVFYDQPQIYQDHKLESSGSWSGFVVETVDYWLNVKTGELILKRPLKQDARLWANYDYHPALNFPEITDMLRKDAIQQAAETENWRMIIDERENVELSERIYEEVIPTMDFSEAYNTILTFNSDPFNGLPDEVTTVNGSGIVDTPNSIFNDVQEHDYLIMTNGATPPTTGTFLIKSKISDKKIETYHKYDNSEYISGSVKRYVITRTPKSVLLGQTYEGKGVGLLNIIHDSNHKTIRVFSRDFMEQLVEDVDFTITTDGLGYKRINFIDTPRVRNNPAVIVQYRIQPELFELIDTENITHETEDWNEDTIINKVTVKGQRLLPDLTRLSIIKQYTIAPYSRQKRSDVPLIQETNSSGQFDWLPDDERSNYSEKDVTKQNFLLEFEHPMIIGTTAFTVKYGDEAGILLNGTVQHTKRDAAYFWEITGAFGDVNYLVMLENRREFRLCTEADYNDMVDPDTDMWLVDGNNDEVGYGTAPTSKTDIKTATHFYIKQMNGAYAREDSLYIVYNIKTVDYYIDGEGRVVQGTIEPNASDQGVFTGYPNKAATIVITPKDSQGATLFEMHGVSGAPGYKTGVNYAKIQSETFALRINRVQVDSKGANLLFDNWGEIEQNIEVNITGYPLSRVEKIDVEAGPTNTEIEEYGERDKEIENLFISEMYQAQSLAYGLRNYWKDEKSKFSTTIILAPHLQLEDIGEVTNPVENLDAVLMEILEMVDHIKCSGPSVTDLILQSVMDDLYQYHWGFEVKEINVETAIMLSDSIAEEREANIETPITVSDEVIEEHELDVETEITVSDGVVEEHELDVETEITVSDSIAEEREANIETPITVSDEVKAKILEVTAPNGGETWLEGENHDITWNYMAGITNVKIEYSVDNGANWSSVINSTPCDGTYSWLIPNENSNQCLIKISDADDSAIFDISDDVFTIAT